MTATAMKTKTAKTTPVHKLFNNNLVPVSAPIRALASSVVGKTRRISAMDCYSTTPAIRADSRKAVREMIDLLTQLGSEMDLKG